MFDYKFIQQEGRFYELCLDLLVFLFISDVESYHL